MADTRPKKQIPLRLSAKLYDQIAAWAEDDFRSVNGQIEYLLTECVRQRKKNGKYVSDTMDEPPELDIELISYFSEQGVPHTSLPFFLSFLIFYKREYEATINRIIIGFYIFFDPVNQRLFFYLTSGGHREKNPVAYFIICRIVRTRLRQDT